MTIVRTTRNPKEQYDLIHFLGNPDGAWVMPAFMKRVVAHPITLRQEPPIALGTRDPYTPGRR